MTLEQFCDVLKQAADQVQHFESVGDSAGEHHILTHNKATIQNKIFLSRNGKAQKYDYTLKNKNKQTGKDFNRPML